MLLCVIQFPLSVSFHQCSCFPCQYHSTNAPFPPCQYYSTNAPISPVNIIPPILQFPLSVSFHQCSNFPCQYHSTNAPISPVSIIPTVLQFPLSVSFDQFSIFPSTYHSTNAPFPPVSIIPPIIQFTLSVSFHQFSNIPCQYHSTNAPYLFCLITVLLRRTSGRNLGLTNKAVLCQIPAEDLTEIYRHIVSVFTGLPQSNGPHIYFRAGRYVVQFRAVPVLHTVRTATSQ